MGGRWRGGRICIPLLSKSPKTDKETSLVGLETEEMEAVVGLCRASRRGLESRLVAVAGR